MALYDPFEDGGPKKYDKAPEPAAPAKASGGSTLYDPFEDGGPKKYDKGEKPAVPGATVSDVPDLNEVRARNARIDEDNGESTWSKIGKLVANEHGELGAKALGALETVASVGSGIGSSILGTFAGLDRAARYRDMGKFPEGFGDTVDALTYQPRTVEGQDMTGDVGDFMNRNLVPLGPLAQVSAAAAAHAAAPKVPLRELPGQLADLGQDIGSRILGSDATGADPALLDRLGPGEQAPLLRIEVRGTNTPRAEPTLPVDVAPADPAAAAAPAATPAPQVQTPAVNPNVARNQALAERLGVPFTPGQLAEDPQMLHDEAALRAPEIRSLMESQPQALTDALDAHRAKVAPDFVDLDRDGINESAVDAFKQAAKANADKVDAKWKAFEDANPQGIKLNAGGLVEDVAKRLDEAGLDEDSAAATWAKRLQKYAPLTDEEQAAAAAGQTVRTPKELTMSRWKQLRSDLASDINAAQGSSKRALGEVRNALENIDMQGNESTRALLDEARAATKQNYDMRRAAPAYDDVHDGTASVSTFADKYLIGRGATVEKIQAADRIMADNPQWKQMKEAATLAYLKQRAVDPVTGQLNPKYLANAMQALGGQKLNNLLSPESLAHLTDIVEAGRIAKYRGLSTMGKAPAIPSAPEAPAEPFILPLRAPQPKGLVGRVVGAVGNMAANKLGPVGKIGKGLYSITSELANRGEREAITEANTNARASYTAAMANHAAEMARLQEQARNEAINRAVGGLTQHANMPPGVRLNGLGNMPSIYH